MAHTFPRSEGADTEVSGSQGGMIVLGLALAALFLAGLYSRADAWLVWLDCAVAVVSLVAGYAPSRVPAFMKTTPMVIGGALLALWIVALAIDADRMMAWWTFAFGIAYLLLGIGAALPVRGSARAPSSMSSMSGPRPI